ncbi:MAG: oligopeptide/dipeptide ABC transporter ATP-binding protein [Syntrophobacteraceae bacterium]
MILEARELTLRAGKSVFPVWRASLALERGEKLAVVGESGGGKTSLAWALAGRPLPGQTRVSGAVEFDGMELFSLPAAERANLYYRRIALVPQNAQNSFHPAQPLWKSAREVAALTSSEAPGRDAVLDRLEAGGKALELPPGLWLQFPHRLSGGQKQRMALLLALMNRPEVLLLDEPTNALDELTREKTAAHLACHLAETGAGAILFTHDIGMAERWADRIAVFYRGQIVEEAPARMLQNPLHPYTRGLVGASVRLGDPPLSRDGIPGQATPLSGPPGQCGFFDRCPNAREQCAWSAPRLQGRGSRRVRCIMEMQP